MKDNLIIPVLALAGLLQVAAVAYAYPHVASKELLRLHDGSTQITVGQDPTETRARQNQALVGWPMRPAQSAM
jgi:hypothetical protein